MGNCVVRPVMFCIALTASPLSLRAQSDVAFPPEIYAARRAGLAEAVDGAPVIVLGSYLIRSGGQGKQDPNFWYLTGVESPYAILVTTGDERGSRREVLFLPQRYQFAGAQYPMAEQRFRGAAWNQPIRRLAPGPRLGRWRAARYGRDSGSSARSNRSFTGILIAYLFFINMEPSE